ncbi:hypothetical protein BV898_02765 [Hypsibius exemplaris]|uniref:Protein quiver n=1 Tax=Hypsibius exemplaris TaxID=2072580 RepID=A0A1W0X716_HYPEX|nr:hypothetical protein BV898_02765 [Hypsibius exemplaris]
MVRFWGSLLFLSIVICAAVALPATTTENRLEKMPKQRCHICEEKLTTPTGRHCGAEPFDPTAPGVNEAWCYVREMCVVRRLTRWKNGALEVELVRNCTNKKHDEFVRNYQAKVPGCAFLDGGGESATFCYCHEDMCNSYFVSDSLPYGQIMPLESSLTTTTSTTTDDEEYLYEEQFVESDVKELQLPVASASVARSSSSCGDTAASVRGIHPLALLILALLPRA